MIRLKKPLLLMTFLFVAGDVVAACSSGMNRTPVANFPNVTIPRDAPVGTLLYSGTMSTSVNVSANTGSSFHIQARGFPYGASDVRYNDKVVFNTGLNGVGIAFNYTTGGPTGFDVDSRSGSFTGNIDGSMEYYIVKTGNISGGSFNNRITGLYYNCAGVNLSSPYGRDIYTSGTVIVSACRVLQTNLNVPMGRLPVREFSGVGSAPDNKEYEIPLDCDANIRVSMTLDATADSSGAPGVMAIDSSSPGNSASGVGIQLLYNNLPITFNSPITIGTVPSAGPYNIPMIARYYQTSADISAGQANGVATLTMTYN